MERKIQAKFCKVTIILFNQKFQEISYQNFYRKMIFVVKLSVAQFNYNLTEYTYHIFIKIIIIIVNWNLNILTLRILSIWRPTYILRFRIRIIKYF